MTQPLAERDIADFLPHRAPMILIDAVVEHSQDRLLTKVKISEQSPYFDDARALVPNYVGIEYMAQSIAALAGVEAEARGDIIRVGFLLGSRKLSMHTPGFLPGREYLTQVQRLYQEDTGLAVFDCRIFDGDTEIASANVNVFQPQDTQAYIAGSLKAIQGDSA
ncbi:hotdog family protein [Shewanella algae]|uniref:hotdog family protein n=1 Tax=Shewanella algae TaxID=38313 RepID=UPI00222F9822|nr:hotdog family protein [Shewanella algae]UZD58244.1 hotdog family protein [Shewanella algae]